MAMARMDPWAAPMPPPVPLPTELSNPLPPSSPPPQCATPAPDLRKFRDRINKKIEEVTRKPLDRDKTNDWDAELLRVVSSTLSKEMQELGQKLREETREDLRHFVEEHATRLQQFLEQNSVPAAAKLSPTVVPFFRKTCGNHAPPSLTIPAITSGDAATKSRGGLSSSPLTTWKRSGRSISNGVGSANLADQFRHSDFQVHRSFQTDDVGVCKKDSTRSLRSLKSLCNPPRVPGTVQDDETESSPKTPKALSRGFSKTWEGTSSTPKASRVSQVTPHEDGPASRRGRAAVIGRDHWKPSHRAYAKWQSKQRKRVSFSSDPASAMVMDKVRGLHENTEKDSVEQKALSFAAKCRHLISCVVESDYFDYTISAMLVLNAAVIGFQADYMTEHVENHTEVRIPTPYRVMNMIFCIIFTLELGFRIILDHWRFWSWHGETWKWNWFDTINVSLSIFEEFFVPQLAGTKMMELATGMGVVRALRICRVARLVRMVRLIPELKSMVYLILASTSSFIWTCILMTILMYCFAVYFTELVTDMVMNNSEHDDLSDVLKYWGSIERSILSLYQAMTGGVSWHMCVDVFDRDGSSFWFNAVIFGIYIAFTTLVVLNLVTGVFVEGAQRIMSEERDEHLINMASKVFIDADLDCSACLDQEEFEALLETNLMNDFLRETGLRKSDAGRLFHVFDEDGSGDLSLMEFVGGCLRMNATAKTTDVAEMRYEMRVMSEQLFKCFGAVEEAMLGVTVSQTMSEEPDGKMETISKTAAWSTDALAFDSSMPLGGHVDSDTDN